MIDLSAQAFSDFLRGKNQYIRGKKSVHTVKANLKIHFLSGLPREFFNKVHKFHQQKK